MIKQMNPGKTYHNNAENVILTIAENNLAAYLTFRESPGFIDENDILKLLKQANITHGYASAINYNQQHNIAKEIDKPFLIALGTDPNSKPEISLLFNRAKCFNPNDSFSVFDMAQYISIKKGEALAEVSVALSSQAGKDIFGNDINKFSKDEPSIYDYIGKNIKFDEESNTLIALTSGYPYIDGSNHIQIKSDFYINENLEEVNLELFGDLVVNGMVINSNLEIKGDLMIYGDIEDCLDYGIFAEGDITLDNAENSRLVSKGQIKFHNEVKNCLISANEGIWGDENSVLSGGLLQSSNSITLFKVGEEKPTRTEIEIALSTFTKEQLKRVQSKLDALTNPTKKIKADPGLADTYNRQLHELENQYLEEVDNILKAPPKRFKISVIKKTYPEVLFRILNHSSVVKEERGKISFTLINNELVINEVDRFV